MDRIAAALVILVTFAMFVALALLVIVVPSYFWVRGAGSPGRRDTRLQPIALRR